MPPDAAAVFGADPGAAASGASVVRLHATCVALAGAGVLLLGRSGSGKSDLALRLIDAGAGLVADDQVLVEARGGRLYGRAPPALAGLLEVRGLGLVRLPFSAEAALAVAVELVSAPPERLPRPRTWQLLELDLPCLQVDARAPSSAAVVKLALSAEFHM